MKILIADSFPQTHIAQLEQLGHTITFDASLSDQALAEAINDYEILIVRSTKVTAGIFDMAQALKLVIRAGAGTNTIDKTHAANLGIKVCNVPGANAIAVAELTLGLILAIDRGLIANDNDLKNGMWNKKRYSKTRGIYGQSLGILGFGAIGYAVAERAHAFGMQVYVIAKPGRNVQTETKMEKVGIIQLNSEDELLNQCNIISIHLPANDDTKGMVNASFLSKMKDNAVLINTSRGELVNEPALVDAMDNKGIVVGLDVYQNEPDTGESNFDSMVAKHPNVCGTHHIGASTNQAQTAVSDGVVRIIESFEQDKLIHCVN